MLYMIPHLILYQICLTLKGHYVYWDCSTKRIECYINTSQYINTILTDAEDRWCAQDGGGRAETARLKWGETNLRSPRQPRSSRVLWPTCLQPLTSKPTSSNTFSMAMHPEPPSLWEPPSGIRRPHKVNLPFSPVQTPLSCALTALRGIFYAPLFHNHHLVFWDGRFESLSILVVMCHRPCM